MMNDDQFNEAVAELIKRGYSKEEASRIANLIGDDIEEDENGKWVARDDNGIVIARVDPL